MSRIFLLKGVAISVMGAVILIALTLVGSVIADRQSYRDSAVHSIEESYAGPQSVIGPVLIRPYEVTLTTIETSDKGVKRTSIHKEQRIATSFPQSLEIKGAMMPSERRHGLYRVEVYEFEGHLKGTFAFDDPKADGPVVWGEPYLVLEVADVRGIVGTPDVIVNGVQERMLQGAPPGTGWQPNVRVPLNGKTTLKGPVDFQVDLTLGGTQMLSLAPVGDSNRLEIGSTWRSPLFAGQFLPRTREINDHGFHAVWEVSSLASGSQVQIMSSSPKGVDVVSVSLTTLLDPYSLSTRAVKYGILFVVLTFGGFFIFELMKHLPIHPIQYLLVGFGLAIFFLLLVSFSEHLRFGLAYLYASVACISLLTFYLSFVLHSAGRGLGFGGLLTCFYAAIYELLISEDNALIMGSVMLFFVLGLVMFVTRKVDWYRGVMGRVAEGAQAPVQIPARPIPPPSQPPASPSASTS